MPIVVLLEPFPEAFLDDLRALVRGDEERSVLVLEIVEDDERGGLQRTDLDLLDQATGVDVGLRPITRSHCTTQVACRASPTRRYQNVAQIESSAGGQSADFWGQSFESYDAAISAAVEASQQALAGKTFETLEVIEFRGGFSNGRLQYQVAIRIWYA